MLVLVQEEMLLVVPLQVRFVFLCHQPFPTAPFPSEAVDSTFLVGCHWIKKVFFFVLEWDGFDGRCAPPHALFSLASRETEGYLGTWVPGYT